MAKKFDVATLIEVLEHIPPSEVSSFLNAVHSLIRENGKLILTVPSNNVRVPQKHYQHFDAQALTKALAPYFTISEINFINVKSWQESVLCRLFSNKFFVLNHKSIATYLFNYYKNNYFFGTPKNAKRLVAVCLKK